MQRKLAQKKRKKKRKKIIKKKIISSREKKTKKKNRVYQISFSIQSEQVASNVSQNASREQWKELKNRRRKEELGLAGGGGGGGGGSKNVYKENKIKKEAYAHKEDDSIPSAGWQSREWPWQSCLDDKTGVRGSPERESDQTA